MIFPLDGKVWSHSRINMAQNCGLQYKFKYVDRSKPVCEPIGAASNSVGKLLHDIAENCVKQGGKCGFDWAEFDMMLVWGDVLRNRTFTQAEMDILMERRSGLERVLEQVFTFIRKYGLKPSVEAMLLMDVDGNMADDRTPWPRRAYIGYVDLMGITADKKSVLFLDFKSHYKPKVPYEATEWQRKFYYYFLLKMHPEVNFIQGGTAYIPSGEISLDVPAKTRNDMPQLEEDLTAYVSRSLADVTAGRFDAQTGRHCDWCGWYTVCPAQQELAAKPKAKRGKKAA